MFDLKIVSDRRVIFDDTAANVMVDGESTEYEFLSFHAETMGVLRKGNILIDNKYKVSISAGVVSFCDNKCVMIVEEAKG
ncbi:MAG: hypothetical protein WCG06_02525 [Candidatus Omnitrophota bacterium]